jgi:hypothetical protein
MTGEEYPVAVVVTTILYSAGSDYYKCLGAMTS